MSLSVADLISRYIILGDWNQKVRQDPSNSVIEWRIANIKSLPIVSWKVVFRSLTFSKGLCCMVFIRAFIGGGD